MVQRKLTSSLWTKYILYQNLVCKHATWQQLDEHAWRAHDRPCCHKRQYFILSYDSVVRPSLCVVLVTYFVCATSTLSSHAKWNKSDRKKSRPCDFTHLWDIKLKAANQQTMKTNKFKDTDNSMVVTRKKGGGVLKGEGTQMYDDRRGFDLGWWAHNTIYILLPCVTPINLIKKKKKNQIYFWVKWHCEY